MLHDQVYLRTKCLAVLPREALCGRAFAEIHQDELAAKADHRAGSATLGIVERGASPYGDDFEPRAELDRAPLPTCVAGSRALSTCGLRPRPPAPCAPLVGRSVAISGVGDLVSLQVAIAVAIQPIESPLGTGELAS